MLARPQGAAASPSGVAPGGFGSTTSLVDLQPPKQPQPQPRQAEAAPNDSQPADPVVQEVAALERAVAGVLMHQACWCACFWGHCTDLWAHAGGGSPGACAQRQVCLCMRACWGACFRGHCAELWVHAAGGSPGAYAQRQVCLCMQACWRACSWGHCTELWVHAEGGTPGACAQWQPCLLWECAET